MIRSALAHWFAMVVIALGAATVDAVAQQTKAPRPPDRSQLRIETVARGLEHPWALQVLPDGRMLVTERPGRMRLVTASGAVSEPIAGVPAVAAINQGGLLDVALDQIGRAHV